VFESRWIGYTSTDGENKAWDDVTGEVLDFGEVNKARAEEMVEVKKHRVWSKVPIQECWDKTGKPPVKTRWLDISKGDKVHPEMRSRLVAKDYKDCTRLDLFAPTPPLEAVKVLFSLWATEGYGWRRGIDEKMKMDFIDIRRAFFHADAIRDVYVELPEEDNEEGMCGKLLKSMYGTRDAVQNWEEAYSTFMTNVGFRRGKASPCMFYHKDRNLRVVLHGDGFTIVGLEKDLNWFQERIKERFEVKVRGRIGKGEDLKAIRILNRIVSWFPDPPHILSDQETNSRSYLISL
jgi:hypothetical protein